MVAARRGRTTRRRPGAMGAGTSPGRRSAERHRGRPAARTAPGSSTPVGTQRRPRPWAPVRLANTAAAASRATWRSDRPVADAARNVTGELEHAGVDTAVVGDPPTEAVHHHPGELATVAARRIDQVDDGTAAERLGQRQPGLRSGAPDDVRHVAGELRRRSPPAPRRRRRASAATIAMGRPRHEDAGRPSAPGRCRGPRRRLPVRPRAMTARPQRRHGSRPPWPARGCTRTGRAAATGANRSTRRRARPGTRTAFARPRCGPLHVAIVFRRCVVASTEPHSRRSGSEERQKRQTGRPACRRAPRSVVRTEQSWSRQPPAPSRKSS